LSLYRTWIRTIACNIRADPRMRAHRPGSRHREPVTKITPDVTNRTRAA